MARQRTLYKLAGRYLKGNDTAYYGIISEDGKELKVTEEQMAFFVGREQIINVKAQLYKDKVLFRGIGCDIRDLPVIKLDSNGTATVHPAPIIKQQMQQPQQIKQPSSKPIINEGIHRVYNNLTTFNKSIWRKIPDYDEPSIELQGNTIIIQQNLYTIVNDKKIPAYYKYIIHENQNIIYFRQAEYPDTFVFKSKNTNSSIDAMCGLIINILGYVNAKVLKSINSFDDVGEEYTRAFEAYTGASNYFNDVMRELDYKHIDILSMGCTIIQIVRILRYYDSLSDELLDKSVNLFRGGIKHTENIEKGILSYSYSFHVANDFAGTDTDKCIMIAPFSRYDTCVWVSHIAVLPHEREITITPYLEVKNITPLGYYNGHELVKVSYEKRTNYAQQMDLLLKSLKPAKKYISVYLLSEIFSRNIDITIKGDEYETFQIINNNKCIELKHIEDIHNNLAYYIVKFNNKEIECKSIESCNEVIKYLF